MKRIDINSIENIIYIGDIVPKNGNYKSKWKLDYKCDKHTQLKENSRIYFIVIDNEIYKIGSSQCKGGIKSTFIFYEGGLGGSPSLRTFGIHLLIQRELDLQKQIKIYALFDEPKNICIRGLFSYSQQQACIDVKKIENNCCEDYKEVYGKYPCWNFQENCQEFPYDIKLLYKEQVNNRKSTLN